MMKKFILPAFLSLIAAGIFIMSVTGMLDVEKKSRFVQGEIDGDRIDIAAKFTARVAETFGRDGMSVDKGSVLLRLDDGEMRARVDQAKQALAHANALLEKLRNGPRTEEIQRAQAQVKEAEASLTRAMQNHKRCLSLYQTKSISRQEFEEAVKLLGQAEAKRSSAQAALQEALAGTRYEDIRAAEAQVHQLEANLAEVKSMARDLELCAPSSGEISKVLVKQGELAVAGYPAVTMLDMSALWATFFLREDQMPGIRMGQEICGSIPALGEENIVFRIDYIAPMGNYATWRATNDSSSFDLKTFEIHGRPKSVKEGLRPGMSVIFPLPFSASCPTL